MCRLRTVSGLIKGVFQDIHNLQKPIIMLDKIISLRKPLIRAKICDFDESLRLYTLKFVQALCLYYISIYIPAVILVIVGIVWPL